MNENAEGSGGPPLEIFLELRYKLISFNTFLVFKYRIFYFKPFLIDCGRSIIFIVTLIVKVFLQDIRTILVVRTRDYRADQLTNSKKVVHILAPGPKFQSLLSIDFFFNI